MRRAACAVRHESSVGCEPSVRPDPFVRQESSVRRTIMTSSLFSINSINIVTLPPDKAAKMEHFTSSIHPEGNL
eukprot:1161959-Pelagomonas_calceolata.AAC.11